MKTTSTTNGAFTLDVMSLLNENLGGILGGMQCQVGDSLMFAVSRFKSYMTNMMLGHATLESVTPSVNAP
jgi:hypothetical protein